MEDEQDAEQLEVVEEPAVVEKEQKDEGVVGAEAEAEAEAEEEEEAGDFNALFEGLDDEDADTKNNGRAVDDSDNDDDNDNGDDMLGRTGSGSSSNNSSFVGGSQSMSQSSLSFSQQQQHAQLASLKLDLPHSLEPIAKSEKDHGDRLFFVKLPKFLHIEKRPFEEEAYTEEEATKTHDVLNTIRWRKQQENKQSNARLVRWSDGTLGLFIGKFYYDVTENAAGHLHLGASVKNVIANVHQNGEVRTTAVNVEEDYGPMQSQLVFKAVGESEKSTKNVYSGESNQGGLEFISTKEDPIVEQNRLAQKEREIERSRKKLESQRRAKQDKYNSTLSAESLSYYGTANDSEEEEDDDDEDKDASESSSSSTPKRTRKTAAASKFVVPENESDSEDEVETTKKKRAKKRSRTSDDEDDDDY